MSEATVTAPFLFEGTEAELQRFMLLTMVVAGKNARVQQTKLRDMLRNMFRWHYGPWASYNLDIRPFHYIRALDDTAKHLRIVKMGQYNRLAEGIDCLVNRVVTGDLDLHTCSREDLIAIPGVGMKTASFFLLYTRKGMRIACLDTHILKFLDGVGVERVPRATPPAKDYLRLEEAFLTECDKQGMEPYALDFQLWLHYSGHQQQAHETKSDHDIEAGALAAPVEVQG